MAQAISIPNSFFVGGAIAVENTRSEMLYRGTIEKIEGTRLQVRLPAADKRRYFVFDLANADLVRVEGSTLFASW